MRGWLLVVGVVFLVYVAVNAFVRMRTQPQQHNLFPDQMALQEKWVLEWIGLLDNYADILATVKDEKSAREAATRIDSLVQRINALAERAATLPKMTKQEGERLKQQHLAQWNSVEKRVQTLGPQAEEKANGEPTLARAMERFWAAAEKLAKV